MGIADMSIQEWGAIGELIGGVAVILTLIYLARQIKAQTKEARLSATRDLARDWAEMLRFVSRDDQNFDLYTRALQDYANLSDGERVKAYMMFSQAMRLLEIHYLHLSEGNFEPKLFCCDGVSCKGAERISRCTAVLGGQSTAV